MEKYILQNYSKNKMCLGNILSNSMGTQKSELLKMPTEEDRFYICHECGFLGWRTKAQGPCCKQPSQEYVVKEVDVKRGVVTIGPRSK